MLYLMALQELTKCPFRVVDEINQVLSTTLSDCYTLNMKQIAKNYLLDCSCYTNFSLFQGAPPDRLQSKVQVVVSLGS